MSGETILTQESLKTSYNQLFGRHYPDILYVQADRPHNYNLLLKIVALLILLVVIPILTLLPIYPLLYILMMYNFDGTAAFSSGTGRMNVFWIGLLYFYYIFGFTKMNKNSSGADFIGSIGFNSLFMGLTPIFILLTWYYASPVSIHDTIAATYNSLTGGLPFLRGGIGFTNMRCPGDVLQQVELLGGNIDQIGGGMGDGLLSSLGGLSGILMIVLMGIIIGGILLLFWLRYYNENIGEQEMNVKLNERLKQSVKIIRK